MDQPAGSSIVIAADAITWAERVGAPDVDDAPPLPKDAAGLLRRLDFPAAGTPVRPPVPAAGPPSEAA
jgi:hypothetical protein